MSFDYGAQLPTPRRLQQRKIEPRGFDDAPRHGWREYWHRAGRLDLCRSMQGLTNDCGPCLDSDTRPTPQANVWISVGTMRHPVRRAWWIGALKNSFVLCTLENFSLAGLTMASCTAIVELHGISFERTTRRYQPWTVNK